MKKALISLLLLTTIYSMTFGGNAYTDNSKKAGLVSYLTAIKSLAEHKMISLASNPEYIKQPQKAENFRYSYNLLKLSTDRFINQLSIDMIDKNSVKKYRRLNKYLKGEINNLPENLAVYKTLLVEIDDQMETIMLKTYSSMLAGPALSDIISGVELVHTVVTDMRDFREKKVQATIGILTNLKLEKVKDLTENKKTD